MPNARNDEATASAASETDPRPIVTLRRRGAPGLAIMATAAILAVVLFVALDGKRRHAASARAPSWATQVDAFEAPPPLLIPREPTNTVAEPQAPPPPPPPPLARPVPAPANFADRGAPNMITTPPPRTPAPVFVAQAVEHDPPRLKEPALVIDGGVEQNSETAGKTSAAATPASGPTPVTVDDTPLRASVIGSLATTMPAGAMIPATLETSIDTARPGLVRAIVSQDTASFDGKRVLVPSGSRLIGEYQSDVRSGQNRVLINWTRLIRPDGVTIRLASPGADALGGAGVPGRVRSFFLQRFGSAVLQSALEVGVNLASRTNNSAVVLDLPNQGISNVVGQQLASGNDLRPKITVKQGATVNVFVARDLDFSGVPLWR